MINEIERLRSELKALNEYCENLEYTINNTAQAVHFGAYKFYKIAEATPDENLEEEYREFMETALLLCRNACKVIHPKTTEYWLYRLFNNEGDLLYIGITKQRYERWRQHEKTQPWIKEATTWKWELILPWLNPHEVEKAAIKAERPLYNIIHNQQPAA